MSRKKLTDFEFVWKSYGRFKEGPPNLGLMRALLLRNTHTGMAKLPLSPELDCWKAQGLRDEEGGLRCWCNKRYATYLWGLARRKNKHKAAVSSDRLMWGSICWCGLWNRIAVENK
jgi:hypothetical protein